MPEEIAAGGETTEGAVPAEAGETAGSTAAAPSPAEETGSPEGSEPKPGEQSVAPKAVDWESQYKHLEGKLGNWKETEAAAQQWRTQQEQAQNAAPEEEPMPEQFNTPQELADFIDRRAEAKMQAMLQQEVSPLANDVYARQAREAIEKMRADHPDFDQHREAIDQYLDQHPAIADALNDTVLEDVYKIVTWKTAKDAGAQEALARLTKKEQTATGAAAGASAPTTPARAHSFEEAYQSAEQTHGSP